MEVWCGEKDPWPIDRQGEAVSAKGGLSLPELTKYILTPTAERTK